MGLWDEKCLKSEEFKNLAPVSSFSSVQFSCSVVSDSATPMGL